MLPPLTSGNRFQRRPRGFLRKEFSVSDSWGRQFQSRLRGFLRKRFSDSWGQRSTWLRPSRITHCWSRTRGVLSGLQAILQVDKVLRFSNNFGRGACHLHYWQNLGKPHFQIITFLDRSGFIWVSWQRRCLRRKKFPINTFLRST